MRDPGAARARGDGTGRAGCPALHCTALPSRGIGFYWVTEVVGDAVHIIGVKLLKRGLDPCVRSLMSSFLLHNLTQQSARGLQQ